LHHTFNPFSIFVINHFQSFFYTQNVFKKSQLYELIFQINTLIWRNADHKNFIFFGNFHKGDWIFFYINLHAHSKIIQIQYFLKSSGIPLIAIIEK
jgi:hypothetical protein